VDPQVFKNDRSTSAPR